MNFSILICIILFIHNHSFAQKDSTKKETPKNHNIFRLALNAISKKSPDSVTEASILNTKSETPFMQYQGKNIRHIIIKPYGFDKIFADTTKRINYFGTKILNYLHTNTKEQVIRNNLFITEKSTINAYKLADNERYLRSLEFIQDARIIVNTIPNEPDSVDIFIITKDLFSLTAGLGELSKNRFKAQIGDANILGIGQKLQFSTLLEKNRIPNFGFEFLYSKNSIAHSFINANFSFSTINSNLNNGQQNENAWYIQLQRPLVSQYSHFAGALTIGQNRPYNTYRIQDSLFYKYNYYKYDAWLGYNLGVKKFLNNTAIKNRQFVGVRYFTTNFTQLPYQIKDPYNFKFSNQQALLAQFTFFRQNFYKTNYIYGLGTTEDVPNGHNIAFTTGWYQQSTLKRFYLGIDANRYIATNQGDFIQYFLRTRTFINQKQWQDAGLLFGTSVYSRLVVYRNLKIRQYIGLSYTKLFNRIGLDPLRIDNPYGLRYFSSDAITGDQRISLHAETSFFITYKLLGFKFAPFTFGDISLLTPENKMLAKSDIYYGTGGGIRARNENLIFGTIELRFIYFPRKTEQTNSFKLSLSTNILFKYNSNYVKTPDIIQFNNDSNNNIY